MSDLLKRERGKADPEASAVYLACSSSLCFFFHKCVPRMVTTYFLHRHLRRLLLLLFFSHQSISLFVVVLSRAPTVMPKSFSQ